MRYTNFLFYSNIKLISSWIQNFLVWQIRSLLETQCFFQKFRIIAKFICWFENMGQTNFLLLFQYKIEFILNFLCQIWPLLETSCFFQIIFRAFLDAKIRCQIKRFAWINSNPPIFAQLVVLHKKPMLVHHKWTWSPYHMGHHPLSLDEAWHISCSYNDCSHVKYGRTRSGFEGIL